MSEFVYVLRARRPEMVAVGPSPEEAAVLERHSAYLRRLTERGTVILAGRTQEDDERTFGIVVFRAEDRAAARRIMEADPAVEENVMDAEVHPFSIAFAPPGSA